VKVWNREGPRRAEALAEAHECAALDCRVLCSPGHIACRDHWFAVPKVERVPLIAAFRRREQDPQAYAVAVELGRRLVQLHTQRELAHA
jgi:hypothetical protein